MQQSIHSVAQNARAIHVIKNSLDRAYIICYTFSMKPINRLKLKAWREERKLTLEGMARELGVSYVSVSRWERGVNKRGVSPLAWKRLEHAGYRE